MNVLMENDVRLPSGHWRCLFFLLAFIRCMGGLSVHSACFCQILCEWELSVSGGIIFLCIFN